MGTYYELLGVSRTATDQEIRQAFRQMAKTRHPDANPGAEAAMVRLNLAYETLRDRNKRQAYDATLVPAYKSGGRPKRPSRPAPTATDPYRFLAMVFNPADQSIVEAVARLEQAIDDLAYDLYDDQYVSIFDQAVERAKGVLRDADLTFRTQVWPGRLTDGLHLYGQGMRQIEDALEDFSNFVMNFDSDLIVQGRAILKVGRELLDEARMALVRA
jgi:curved DNA-binding protein CbpA